jgi:hypothetical protein
VAEPVEHLEVDVDATTAAYLRRRCIPRGDLAGAAAAALRELAVRDAATSLAAWYAAHPGYAEDQEHENAEALARLT